MFEDLAVAKMMHSVPLFLVCILFPAVQAIQLTKCEVYEAMKDMDGLQGITALEWTCIIFHSSGYDPQAIVKNNNSTEYGLFQISNKHWCMSSEIPESENICDMSCDKLLDYNLTDDKMCAQKILAIKGIDYWLAHKPLCSDRLDQWHCKNL